MSVMIVLAATALSAAVISLTAGAITGRMVVRWSWPILTRVHRWGPGWVELESTPLTRYDGTYGLRTASGHARVGRVMSTTNRTVTRAVESLQGNVAGSTAAAFDGDLHATPGDIGNYTDIEIRTAIGPAPAWLFESPTEVGTWAIHIHGFQADRNNALRSVVPLLGLPLTHLVVSYRGDGQGPAVPRGVSRLGLDEWRDVDAAVSHAINHGAKRILLCGWSMGATISLLLSERSAHRDRIIGQVFVSPATDWLAIIRAGASRLRVPFPSVLARYTAFVLSTPLLCRLAGLRTPLDFDSLNWIGPGRVRTPTLVVHSIGDLTVPLEASRLFADAAPELVQLHEAPRAAHTREFNVDPDGVSAEIRRWVSNLAL